MTGNAHYTIQAGSSSKEVNAVNKLDRTMKAAENAVSISSRWTQGKSAEIENSRPGAASNAEVENEPDTK